MVIFTLFKEIVSVSLKKRAKRVGFIKDKICVMNKHGRGTTITKVPRIGLKWLKFKSDNVICLFTIYGHASR